MWSRIGDIGKRVEETSSEFAGRFALRSLKKNYLPWLIEYLDGLGRDNLTFAVEDGITLWQIIPEAWREMAVRDRSPRSHLADRLDPMEAGTVIFESLIEERPDYATILSKEWVIRSCEDYRRSRHGGR